MMELNEKETKLTKSLMRWINNNCNWTEQSRIEMLQLSIRKEWQTRQCQVEVKQNKTKIQTYKLHCPWSCLKEKALNLFNPFLKCNTPNKPKSTHRKPKSSAIVVFFIQFSRLMQSRAVELLRAIGGSSTSTSWLYG